MVADPAAELRAYAERGDPGPPARSRPRALARRVLGDQARQALRTAATELQRPRARRRARSIQAGSGGPLRLHLGAGMLYKDGWTNIDLLGTRVDVAWNLARGIPFADGRADGVLHEHLLEHLDLRAGLAFTRECLRVLRPGGVLRIGVPDAGACLRWYAGEPSPYWSQPPRPTRLLAVHSLVYGFGHRAMYDAETLMLLCRAGGFTDAREHAWGEGELGALGDSPERRGWTLYVEARRGR